METHSYSTTQPEQSLRRVSCHAEHLGPRRAGRSPGWPERGIPPTSPRATTRRPGGRSEQAPPTVTSRAAPGPSRGRAAPGRRDATRASVWWAERIRSTPVRSAHHARRRTSTNPHVMRHATAPVVSTRYAASPLTRKRSLSCGHGAGNGGDPSPDVDRSSYAVRAASRANLCGDPEPHTEPSLRERLTAPLDTTRTAPKLASIREGLP